TQVDAWLPWGLDAKPQAALAALNAPRLERALGHIADALGLSVDTESGTKFANHDGLKLVNQYDATGAPIDCTTLLRACNELHLASASPRASHSRSHPHGRGE